MSTSREQSPRSIPLEEKLEPIRKGLPQYPRVIDWQFLPEEARTFDVFSETCRTAPKEELLALSARREPAITAGLVYLVGTTGKLFESYVNGAYYLEKLLPLYVSQFGTEYVDQEGQRAAVVKYNGQYTTPEEEIRYIDSKREQARLGWFTGPMNASLEAQVALGILSGSMYYELRRQHTSWRKYRALPIFPEGKSAINRRRIQNLFHRYISYDHELASEIMRYALDEDPNCEPPRPSLSQREFLSSLQKISRR